MERSVIINSEKDKMKKRNLSIRIKSILAGCLLVCGGHLFRAEAQAPSWLQIKPEAKQRLGLVYEVVNVEIPGLKKEYKFIWISDLHVMAQDVSEIQDEWKAAMIHRRDKRFNNPQSDLPPAAVWKQLPEILNHSNADALFFGGDMCDTGSAANLAFLKSGFKQLTKPFIYLKEDHDITPWHLISRDLSKQHAIAKEIDGFPGLHCLEFDELVVLGYSYSVGHIKKPVLEQFKKLYRKAVAEKKAVILVQHVPISPENDPVLSKTHCWGGKMKTTFPTTAEYLKLVKAENGPVKAVFCGHNHMTWDGMVTPTLYQHVFDGAFKGHIGIITVKPAKNIHGKAEK